ncbi:MAG TPA: hypothetical protein VMG12_02660 [Polyangiaceae bacterium]|nr:hypothetical protein [Polyangiaceae bacterium]
MPDWLFDNFLFGTWPGRWLARNTFGEFTTTLSIGISLVSSALFMLDERARKLGRPVSQRVERAVCLTLTLLSFFVYYDFFNPNTRYHNYYHRHEFYHYYLGSKYFDEIGYDRLYTCTAVAEVEAGRRSAIERADIRVLGGSNLVVPMRETFVLTDPDQCKRHFTPERWQAFRTDVEWFYASSRGEYWDKMKKDHGYNPPPVWTMTGQLLASLAPAGDHFFKLLAGIDIVLQLGALLLIRWAFGRRIMAIAAVFWGCNAPASFFFTCGAFLRQDWYFLFVAALCLARKRRFALSGAALTWSTALRAFPVVFFVGVALVMFFDVLRKRRLARDHRNFILGSALSGALLFGASCAVSGVDSYRAFVAHIALHKDTPLTNNMGLEMLITASWSGRMQATIDSRLDDDVQPWKEGYTARKHERRPLQLAIAALVLGWMAWALRGTRRLWAGMALSLPLMMSLLNLTCYYYCFFIAGATLVALCPALAPAYLALAGASQVLAIRFHWFDDQHVALSLLFYAFALSTLYAVSRPLRARRYAARAWNQI